MSSLLVNVTPIDQIVAHPNADNLQIVLIKGWSVVTQKGKYQPGELIVYVPPDCVLPSALSDRLEVTKYLSKGRVKSIKLRGVVSCGLIMDNEGGWQNGINVADQLGITKYEPPEPHKMGGQNVAEPIGFHRYTDIENWNNYPYLFLNNQWVYITEKIHGTNWRAGLINGQFYVGSHHCCKEVNNDNLYSQIALKYDIESRMKKLDPTKNWILFGEVFGSIQDLKYTLNKSTELRLFDISCGGTYLDYEHFEGVTEDVLGLECVPCLVVHKYSKELIESYCQGQAFQGDHLREGIVIRPEQETWDPEVGRVILKKINPEYLVRKHGTEHH